MLYMEMIRFYEAMSETISSGRPSLAFDFAYRNSIGSQNFYILSSLLFVSLCCVEP